MKNGISKSQLSRYNHLWVMFSKPAAEVAKGFSFKINYDIFGKLMFEVSKRSGVVFVII